MDRIPVKNNLKGPPCLWFMTGFLNLPQMQAMLRCIMCISVLFAFSFLKAQTTAMLTVYSPLASYSAEWKKPQYRSCNTASVATYMTAEEQEVILILNMLRSNPTLFLQSVLLNPRSPYYVRPGEKNTYKTSLLRDIRNLKRTDLMLQPDSTLYVSALCHAASSGKAGYVGHERLSDCQGTYRAECIAYGGGNPLAVVVQLLFDEDVPSLGHRKILTDFSYSEIGTATRPHSGYGSNSVVDFR